MTDLDLFAPELRENPYPRFAELRRDAPVATVVPFGWFAVSRDADVRRVLADGELFKSPVARPLLGELRCFEPALAAPEPSDAARRATAAGAFGGPELDGHERGIRRLAQVAVDRLLERDSLDGLGELVLAYPAACAAEICGVLPARRADFVRQVTDTLAATGTDSGADHPELGELGLGLRQLVEARRQARSNDVVSALIGAAGAALMSDDELAALVMHLVLEGTEIGCDLIGNTLLVLADHPDLLARLREDPELLPAIVEETLRHSSPVLGVLRVATSDTEIAGTVIPAGATVLALVASAGRDESRWSEPDRFDPSRDNRDNLTLGLPESPSPVAARVRLETRVVLETMLERLPEFGRTDGTVGWCGSALYRGPRSLPVAFIE